MEHLSGFHLVAIKPLNFEKEKIIIKTPDTFEAINFYIESRNTKHYCPSKLILSSETLANYEYWFYDLTLRPL